MGRVVTATRPPPSVRSPTKSAGADGSHRCPDGWILLLVAGCCDPRGCNEMFGKGFARRMAKRYRRRGLDRTAERMVEFLAGHGLEGATVLEIGGGVGEIHLELLRRRAASATSLELSTADLVVLHRVVCCYPDFEKLLGAAADHCRGLLVFSHPPQNAVSRTVVGTQNALFGLVGKRFRTFAHPPEAMFSVLNAHGLDTRFTHAGRIWQVGGLTR